MRGLLVNARTSGDKVEAVVDAARCDQLAPADQDMMTRGITCALAGPDKLGGQVAIGPAHLEVAGAS